MKTMKFNTIKNNARYAFLIASGGHRGMYVSRISPGSVKNDGIFLALLVAARVGESPTEIFNEWIDYGCNLIRNWDVRCVSGLIKLFPGCVPASCHNRTISADYNEKGEWVVNFH